MKKVLLSLLAVVPLVSCTTASIPTINQLKVASKGHFSDAQLNYLSSDNYTDTTPYNGNMSVSKPLPINISWENLENKAYKVEIYHDQSCNDSSLITSYVVEGNAFDFYNPEFNKEYYVKVVSKENEKITAQSEVVSFKEIPAVPGPRNLFVDGVENFRDIGGWGKFVNNQYQTYMKQGMLYRSGRFNEDSVEQVNVTITNNGLQEINNHLKIKTEIDLRRTSTNEVGALTNKSPLGDNVNYIQIPMAFGGKNILTFKGTLSNDSYQYDNPSAIKNFFEVLANENNYPINFHCSIGKDRTGCMAYLIEGLLGFNEEDMCRDYMFTNFADAGMCKISDINDRYGDTISKYENGNTINEKIYNYLNEVIGVSKDNLDKIINILKA